MPSTTTIERGTFALVRFVFADERGAKRRPVLVLSTPSYHAGRHEVIVAAVTSNLSRPLPGDMTVMHWQKSGLAVPSVVTDILRTIKRDMIESSLGRIAPSEMRRYEGELRGVLAL